MRTTFDTDDSRTNAASVLAFHKPTHLCLTGDDIAPSIAAFRRQALPQQQVTTLKVPHHGSRRNSYLPDEGQLPWASLARMYLLLHMLSDDAHGKYPVHMANPMWLPSFRAALEVAAPVARQIVKVGAATCPPLQAMLQCCCRRRP